MPDNHSRCLVWAEPRQLDWIKPVVVAVGLNVVVAGSPVPAQAGAVAAGLSSATADDLRAALAQGDFDVAVLFATGGFGATQEDIRAVAAAQAKGARILTTEPIPSEALDLQTAGWLNSDPSAPQPSAGIRVIGLPRLTLPMRDATETLLAFGRPRTVLIEQWSAPHHGTLSARLVGAVDLLHSLIGETETIDAVYTGPQISTRGQGASLTGLDGDLMATSRMSEGRSGVVVLSNSAGRWNTTITLLSDRGRLRLYDDGFEWIGPDGDKRDEQRAPGRVRGSAAPDHAAAVFADAISRTLDPGVPDEGPINLPSILPVAQAALLSARTLQPENPSTIRRMIST